MHFPFVALFLSSLADFVFALPMVLVGGAEKTNWHLHLVEGKLAHVLKNAQREKTKKKTSLLLRGCWVPLGRPRRNADVPSPGYFPAFLAHPPPPPNAGKSRSRNIFASQSRSCASAFRSSKSSSSGTKRRMRRLLTQWWRQAEERRQQFWTAVAVEIIIIIMMKKKISSRSAPQNFTPRWGLLIASVER